MMPWKWNPTPGQQCYAMVHRQRDKGPVLLSIVKANFVHYQSGWYRLLNTTTGEECSVRSSSSASRLWHPNEKTAILEYLRWNLTEKCRCWHNPSDSDLILQAGLIAEAMYFLEQSRGGLMKYAVYKGN